MTGGWQLEVCRKHCSSPVKQKATHHTNISSTTVTRDRQRQIISSGHVYNSIPYSKIHKNDILSCHFAQIANIKKYSQNLSNQIFK